MSDEESGEEVGPLLDAVTGLPNVSPHDQEKAASAGMKMLGMFLIVPRFLGVAVAYGIYTLGKDVYDQRMDTLTHDGALQLGYLYISLALVAMLTTFMNFYPMVYKGQVLPGNVGNLRANMIIYKVNAVEGKAFPAVVMQEEGTVGKYNRANRALNHYIENGLPVTLAILAGGLIFSLPIMILTILYVVARIWYQIAYSEGGYGMGCCKHMVPFMFHGAILPVIFEGFLWIAGVTMLMAGDMGVVS